MAEDKKILTAEERKALSFKRKKVALIGFAFLLVVIIIIQVVMIIFDLF